MHDREFTLAGEKRRVRAAHGPRSWTASSADPTMHVYHYAPYEPTALKRLMGRHGTREDEVDRLLRGGVLVDLLRASSARACAPPSRATRSSGWSRSTGSRARSTCATRARASSRSRQWLQLGEGERPHADDPRADRALQPGRRRLEPAAARLAGGAARRARRADRGRASRGRCRATTALPADVTRGAGAGRGAGRSRWPTRTTSRATARSARPEAARAAGCWPSS